VKEEEQEPAKFEQPKFDQGNTDTISSFCSYTFNVIYFHCLCLLNANPKDLTSFTYHSLDTWGYVYG
jgi:hypothetical protein